MTKTDATALIILSVHDVLKQLTSNDKSFTTFDVTRLVRAATHHNVSHQLIKEYIHGLWERDSLHPAYERTTHKISDNNWAEVYHPNYELVANYNKDDLMPRSVVFNPTPVTFDVLDDEEDEPSIVPTCQAVDDLKFVGVDGRGRLCVPAEKLKEIGAGAGDKVILFINLDKDELLLARKGNAQIFYLGSDYEELETYTVDEYCNVRIGKNKLKGKKYTFEVDSLTQLMRVLEY